MSDTRTQYTCMVCVYTHTPSHTHTHTCAVYTHTHACIYKAEATPTTAQRSPLVGNMPVLCLDNKTVDPRLGAVTWEQATPGVPKDKGSHPVQQLWPCYLSSRDLSSHPSPGLPLSFIRQLLDTRQLPISME